MKTVCKILRNFTIPILRKIEITIDFNGPKGHLHHSITQKWNSESFLNLLLLRSLPAICTIIYFIWSCEYSNCKAFALMKYSTFFKRKIGSYQVYSDPLLQQLIANIMSMVHPNIRQTSGRRK